MDNLARRGFLGHVIYDVGVRRVVSVCLGALALTGVHAVTHASAQEDATTTTAPATTSTTLAPVAPATTTTSTTVRKNATATSTTVARGGRAVAPPAAGPTQTLVPDLLGGPVDVSTTSTTSTMVPFVTFRNPTPTPVPESTQSAATINVGDDSPSGPTLILAAIAWLASFGGLLVFVEDRRATKWKHLAR